MIDTHAHVYEHCKKGITYTPKNDSKLDDYIQILDTYAIKKAVLVQPSFLGYDNSNLIQSLQQYPDRFRGVVVVSPDTSFEYLKSLDLIGVKGIRLNSFGQDIDMNAYYTLFDYVFELDWHIEIYTKSESLSEVLSKIQNTALKVVVDHFGLAKDMNDTYFLSMLKSKLNLFIKLSAPYRFEYKNIEMLIDTIIRYRGLQNILWGSDYPFTRFEDVYSYDKAVGFISQYVSNNIDVNIKKHLFDNAVSLFDF